MKSAAIHIQMSTFADLPPEIVGKIAGMLLPHDCGRFAQVSKTTGKAAERSGLYVDYRRLRQKCSRSDITEKSEKFYKITMNSIALIGYFVSTFNISKLFRKVLEHASDKHIEKLKFLLSLEETRGRIDIHAYDECAFEWAAEKGHKHILEFLLSLEKTHGRIDIHTDNEHAFRWAAKNDHKHILEFLLSLEETHERIDIHADDECAFRWVVINGHKHIMKLLLSLEKTHGEIRR